MKVLVTGGTGFIGSELIERLLCQGHDVHALVRDVPSAQKKLPFPIQFFRWPDVNAPIPEESFAGVDTIVHLLGEPIAGARWTQKRKQKIYESRVTSTQNLVASITQFKRKPKCILFASAVGYYGDRGNETLDEDSAPGTGFLSDVCKAWEQAALHAADMGIRTVTCRTGVVLGRLGGMLQQVELPFKNGLGGKIGSGQQFMSWIHYKDLVSMMIFALENQHISGVINGTSPEPVTNEVFSHTLRRAVFSSFGLDAPAWALKAALGEMASMALMSQKVMPAKIKSSGFEFDFPNLSVALNNLYQDAGNRIGTLQVLRQWVPRSPNEVFQFFSNARNLPQLNPSWLKLEILGAPEKIEEGTHLNLRFKMRGVPITWQSKIIDYSPISQFVDNQTMGPFQWWNHRHIFLPMKGGTFIKDVINYTVPAGKIGEIAAGRFVKSDLQKIMGFRQGRIKEIFA